MLKKMTKQDLTKEQRENILKARDLIDCNFIWYKTKEGRNYWNKVSYALGRIAKSNVKKCPKCGEILEDD
jgi:ssDNA-binding Zn-finger/Zn-ribbon topoisomerase 1